MPVGNGTQMRKRIEDEFTYLPVSMHIEFDWPGKGKDQTEEALLRALKESRVALRNWLNKA